MSPRCASSLRMICSAWIRVQARRRHLPVDRVDEAQRRGCRRPRTRAGRAARRRCPTRPGTPPSTPDGSTHTSKSGSRTVARTRPASTAGARIRGITAERDDPRRAAELSDRVAHGRDRRATFRSRRTTTKAVEHERDQDDRDDDHEHPACARAAVAARRCRRTARAPTAWTAGSRPGLDRHGVGATERLDHRVAGS